MKNKSVYILGISCDFHDSAAVLLKDGKIVAATQEERFTRKKHDASIPKHSINFCLEYAGIKSSQLDHVGFYENPFLKFERLLINYSQNFPKSYPQFRQAIPIWLKSKLWIKSRLRQFLDYDQEIITIPHHLSHAASSFFCSSFKNSAILTADAVGEWDTTTLGEGNGNTISLLKRIVYPHSLGMLYSAITYYLGFKVNSAEYKVMGLAPYGKVKYMDEFQELIRIEDDGSYQLNMDYFSYEYDDVMTTQKLNTLFGDMPRALESKITQKHFDIARTVQQVTEDVMVKTVKHLRGIVNSDNLCMAGGVALNCVANGNILRSGIYKNLFIQPASGDSGGALGVALYIHNQMLNGKRNELEHVFYGPEYDSRQIKRQLDKMNITYQLLPYNDLITKTAKAIAQKKVVGWFQGRMEFGPRALGNRSIVADPRGRDTQKIVNLKIKFREDFRPFAPTVLEEDISTYFDLDVPTPYMLLTAQTKGGKSKFPAVTHVDNSARIQSINKKQNARYYDLIKEFKKQTGLGMVLNTSFNVRGEPIVQNVKEAVACFLGTNIDILVVGNYYIDKQDNQDNAIDPMKWKQKFDLD